MFVKCKVKIPSQMTYSPISENTEALWYYSHANGIFFNFQPVLLPSSWSRTTKAVLLTIDESFTSVFVGKFRRLMLWYSIDIHWKDKRHLKRWSDGWHAQQNTIRSIFLSFNCPQYQYQGIMSINSSEQQTLFILCECAMWNSGTRG